jgi:hypothetical protein
MIDNLQTLFIVIQTATTELIDIVNKVDSFYNSAWNKLIIFGSISFGIIGLIVPYIIQIYQKRTLKISEELLKTEIETKIGNVKSELLRDVDEKFEKHIKLLDKKLDEFKAEASARTFHLQGNVNISKKIYKSAYGDFVFAAKNYIVCKNYANLNVVLKILLDKCIPNLTFEEINDLKVINKISLETVLDKLEDDDENSAFYKIIQDLRVKINKLQKSNI